MIFEYLDSFTKNKKYKELQLVLVVSLKLTNPDIKEDYHQQKDN